MDTTISSSNVPQLGSARSVAAERIVRGTLYIAAGALALFSAARAVASAAALTAAIALAPVGVGVVLIWFTLRPRPVSPGVRVFPRSVAVAPAVLLSTIGALFVGLGVYLIGITPTLPYAAAPIWIFLIPAGAWTMQLQARGHVKVDVPRRAVWRSGFFLPRRFKFERISAVVVVRTQILSRVTSRVLWEEWQAGLELGSTLVKVGPITSADGAVALVSELSQLTGVCIGAERAEVK